LSFENIVQEDLRLITILTTGSRGDVQPYIALGVELKKASQKVRLVGFENYGDWVKSFGLDYYPIKGDVSMVASSESMLEARTADNPLKLILSFNKLKSLVVDVQKDFFNACAGSDAIVYHPGAPIGYFAARHMGIPSILATPFPMTPTKEYPALIFYNSVRLGKGCNLFTHKLFEQVMWFASSSAVKQFLKKEFGSVPEHYGCPFGRQNTRTNPTIISCSNYVFPRPKDWSEHVISAGYWFLDEEADWKPSADLLQFMHAGKPPVYVGFGSIADPALAAQTTHLVVDALKQSGQRGILATGWKGMSKLDNVPEGIFILEEAPHAWLFPQMTAVIHHGGAGTTAAGLRAGVPSIIVPSSNDQFAWGRRIHELGAGSKPIPRKNLTVAKLADAIKQVMTKEIIITAKDLGNKIRTEKGAETAANIIIDCLAEQRRE
jgi:sterol 3beta-glucosyltransferase